MLVEFRVKNYRSFKDEQVLSMVASNSDTTLEDNYFVIDKFKLLKSVAIYGANASGKSNLIWSLITMRRIITKPPGTKLEDLFIVAEPFLFNKNTINEPTTFEITFFIDKIRYQYGFTANNKRIFDEWLVVYPLKKPQAWIERIYDYKTKETDYNFSTFLKGEKESYKEKTRDDSLYLTVGAQWNNKQLLNVYNWIDRKLRDIPVGIPLQQVTEKKIYDEENVDNKKKKNNVKDIFLNWLKKADLGISDIDVSKNEVDKKIIDDPNLLPEVKKKIIQASERINVSFIHKVQESNLECVFPRFRESDGTQRFFELLGPWLDAISFGITVFLDEIDYKLHSLLTRELIKIIHSSDYKYKGTQLIFTTHDTTLLDPTLFRRDQIWFVEKDRNGASNIYPLSDYKPRKDEALQRGYLSGRYGAIPILEAFEIE